MLKEIVRILWLPKLSLVRNKGFVNYHSSISQTVLNLWDKGALQVIKAYNHVIGSFFNTVLTPQVGNQGFDSNPRFSCRCNSIIYRFRRDINTFYLKTILGEEDSVPSGAHSHVKNSPTG